MALPTRPTVLERDLVERAIAGDSESFSELVRRPRDRWGTPALRLQGDREVAADVAQETAIRTLRSLSSTNRAVVVLENVYRWLHAEVVEGLGIAVTAASVRLHRGRTLLLRDLDGAL